MGVSRRTFSFTFSTAALVLLVLRMWLSSVMAGDAHIAILTSQDTEPYQEVLAGFREYLTRHNRETVFKEYSLQGDTTRALFSAPGHQKKRRQDALDCRVDSNTGSHRRERRLADRCLSHC